MVTGGKSSTWAESFSRSRMQPHFAGYVIAGVVPQFCINGTPQRHLVRHPAILGKEKAVAENNLVGKDEGLTEN